LALAVSIFVIPPSNIITDVLRVVLILRDGTKEAVGVEMGAVCGDEGDFKDRHRGDDDWARCLCWRATGHGNAYIGGVILARVQPHNCNILGYADLVPGQFNVGGLAAVRINVSIWKCTIIGVIVAGGHLSGPN
jgi:hypothetical protein